MSGMTSMLRQRRKDINVKPNRRLDRKSSRGMLYENEELRLRTININAEVERGQTDIKKLKRENDQLKREILALRYEYDKLDQMLRERKSSPEHSDDSASVCSACPECSVGDAGSARAHPQVAFDLSVVPEEDAQDIMSAADGPCTCEECSLNDEEITITPNSKIEVNLKPSSRTNNNKNNSNLNTELNKDNNEIARTVDVLVHDTPNGAPRFFETVTSSPEYNCNLPPPPPPPPGFVISPYQTPRFHNGGNVEDLLGDVQSSPILQTMYVQQNSVFMCNTRKITHQCCCCNQEGLMNNNRSPDNNKKSYVTEKNIEITYDYPKSTQVMKPLPSTTSTPHQGITTEVASTVVFVERRIPVRPKKFDFFFRSRSAPVGENEEPIYATVNKLPKRLKRMELAHLEQEVAYKTNDKPSETSLKTDGTKTDSEHSQAGIQPDDDTSPSEIERTVAPQRPEITKAKKRKKFSLTFKKRERKRLEKKLETPVSPVVKNGIVKNGKNHAVVESDSEQLILGTECLNGHPKLCDRHRGRTTVSSSSSGPRFKRDSYQDITTSHSEHERTNSVCSSVNSSATSACTHKSRKFSAPPHDGSIPWCGCWGAGCI